MFERMTFALSLGAVVGVLFLVFNHDPPDYSGQFLELSSQVTTLTVQLKILSTDVESIKTSDRVEFTKRRTETLRKQVNDDLDLKLKELKKFLMENRCPP